MFHSEWVAPSLEQRGVSGPQQGLPGDDGGGVCEAPLPGPPRSSCYLHRGEMGVQVRAPGRHTPTGRRLSLSDTRELRARLGVAPAAARQTQVRGARREHSGWQAGTRWSGERSGL